MKKHLKTFKNILFPVMLLGLFIQAHAQVGFNNPNPDTTALIDMKANDKGLLIPRMTTVDRTNMTVNGKKPANSLMVFDTDQKMFFFYDTATVPNRWVAMNPWVSQGTTSPNITTATSGNVGIGVNNPTARLHVNGTITSTGTITAPDYALNASGNGPIPKGGIIMWSGNPSANPAGWALCNGQNGTPDLRGRFIVGYDPNDTDYNNTGRIGPVFTDADGNSTGANTQDAKRVRLLSSQSGVPAHSHGINDPGHSHGSNYFQEHSNSWRSGGSGSPGDGTGYNAGTTTTHNTTGISIQNNNAQNASQSIENRPPYFVLAFLIKL